MAKHEVERLAAHIAGLMRIGREEAAMNLYGYALDCGADRDELDEALSEARGE